MVCHARAAPGLETSSELRRTTRYRLVVGDDRLYMIENSAEVPLTRAGDTVTIKYLDTGEKVLPVSEFDNAGL